MPLVRRSLRATVRLVFWPIFLVAAYALALALWHHQPMPPAWVVGSFSTAPRPVGAWESLPNAFTVELAILFFGSQHRLIGGTEVALVPGRAQWLYNPGLRRQAWSPTWAEVEKFEGRLRGELERRLAASTNEGEARRLSVVFHQRPTYRRQYAGFIVGGRRVLIANSIRWTHPRWYDREWLIGLEEPLHGSTDHWQVRCDSTTGELLDLFVGIDG